MVFWGRKQIFSGLGAVVLGVFFIQMRVGAQIPQREEDVAPEREMMEQQAAEAVYGWHSAWNSGPHPSPGQIPAGASITVSFKPLLSIFNSGKFLPLRYAPQELEISLAAATDWLNANNYATSPGTASTSYSISNIQLFYDSVTLDEALSEKLFAALLSNRVLNIPCQQYFLVVQSIPAGSSSYSFSVVRAFSRLTHLWLTFRTANGLVSQEFAMPTLQNTEMTSSWTKNPNFIADMPAPSIRLSIGPKNVPDYQSVMTTQEHFWMLQKSLPATPYLDRKDFASNTFVSVFNLERCPGDPQTAMSTRSGDQIRIDIKGLTPDVCTECWVTIWAMSVCSVRESGISLLD